MHTGKQLLCIGHRGAKGHAPENTVRSIRKAIELGAHCVEVDVWYVDRHLVVFHDERLERTTNGTGYISEQAYDHLRTLDAGDGERIPTLEEVLETVDLRVGVNIELNGPDTAHPVAECIATFRERGWRDTLFLVSSFDHGELVELRRLDPRISIGALIAGPPAGGAGFAEALGAYSVHPAYKRVDRRFIEDAHSRGLRVFVYTVNHPSDIARMRELGVDGVFTDYPERVRTGQSDVPGPPGWSRAPAHTDDRGTSP